MTSALNWNTETMGVDCPTCRTPIQGYNFDSGMTVTIPHAALDGGDKTFVGTSEEVDRATTGAMVFGNPRYEPNATHNRVVLDPCGHSFRGAECNRLLDEIRRVGKVRQHAAHEADIAAEGAVMDAAAAAGHGALADRWREAVRVGSKDASGLLVALKELTTR